MTRALTAVVIVIVTAGACGGANGEGAPQGAAPAQAGMTVVAHSRLEALLPALPGWTRQTPAGDTDTTESVSRVTVDYERPPSTLSIELMDSSKRPEVLALITEALAGRNSELTPATLAGSPAAQQWIAEAQRGAVHVLVAGRFMVVVTGEHVADLDEIRAAAAAIDFQKLAALK